MSDIMGFIQFANDLLDTAQVRKMLGGRGKPVTRQRVSQLVAAGDLKAIKIGQQLMFQRDEVKRFLLARAGLEKK
jgi:helix-turn-helix protein